MKLPVLLISTFITFSIYGQNAQTYNNQGGEHLCGPITIEDLSQKPYSKWFTKGLEDYNPEMAEMTWSENLKDVSVEIYLGTWCGDSKRWVPKFVKLWDQLELDRSQLQLISLYDGAERYKQGPNGEEKGKGIHRVPTFIFSKEGTEIGRIVERPVTSLETDIAQLALGYPVTPNYRAATYMINMFDQNSHEDIEKDWRIHLNAAYDQVGKSGELNTLGYVYLRSGRIQEALTTFRFNTRFFRTNPNVFDSYAEALAISGDTTAAIENYEKVLELDGENKNAQEQLKKLKALK